MYIVVGANGYIGSYIVKNILQHTDDKILALGRTIKDNAVHGRVQCMKCDITCGSDIDSLNCRLAKMSAVKVIYLAACHHPDEVKKNAKAAWNTNITALSQFINKTENIDCLFYVSTEMVYGEGNMEYKFTEKDELHPVNLYGIQKKTAEAVIVGYGYNVVRFPFVIGPSLLPNRKHFYDVIVDTVKNGIEIEMFEDVYKSALDFDTASELLVRLCESYTKDMPQILNVSGDEVLSKYEIAKKIIKKFHMNQNLVKPVKWEQNHGIFTEARAGCTLLDNSLLKEVLQIPEIRMKF